MLEAAETFRRALSGLDIETLDSESCARLVSLLARIERLVRLKKTEAALRATAGGAVGRDGSPDAAAWLARQSGESVRAAKTAFDTVGVLGGACPATAEAVAAGDLSLDQAREIASAATVNPGCEHELIEVARQAPMSTLRDQARKRRHEVIDAPSCTVSN